MSIVQSIRDNALLYKDVTQWLRSRRVGVGTLAFLLGCEAAVVVTAIACHYSDEPHKAGPISAGILIALLIIYAIAIVSEEIRQVTQEWKNQTFDLILLSGLRPEGMAGGWFLAVEVKFLMGLFSVLPFMMVTWLLGGVGFEKIGMVALASLFVAPPVFLFFLWASTFRPQKKKTVSAVIRVILVIVLLNIGGRLIAWAIGNVIQAFAPSMGALTASGGAGNSEPDAWLIATHVIVFSALMLSLSGVLFYAMSSRLAAASDWFDAEGRCVAFMLVACASAQTALGAPLLAGMPPIILLLMIFGMRYLISSAQPSPQEAARRARGGAIRKRVHQVFGNGAWGGFRSMALMVGAVCVFTMGRCLFAWTWETWTQGAHVVSLALQSFWFLGLPAWMALSYGRPNKTGVFGIRVGICIAWVLGTIFSGAVLGENASSATGFSPAWLIGIALSPVTSAAAGIAPGVGALAIPLRTILGIAGLLATIRAMHLLPDASTILENRLKSRKTILSAIQPEASK